MRHPDALLINNCAFVDFDLTGHDFHKRSLAHAITAQQRHTLTGFKLKTKLVKKKRSAKGERYIL